MRSCRSTSTWVIARPRSRRLRRPARFPSSRPTARRPLRPTGRPRPLRSDASSAPARATRAATPTSGFSLAPTPAWAWLDGFLTTERLIELLPEAERFSIDRYRLPNIRSLNFVIHGLLEEGVAASTRQDAQAKSLGEWLRARVVDIPDALLDEM